MFFPDVREKISSFCNQAVKPAGVMCFLLGPLEEITVCLVFSSSLFFLNEVKNEQKP